MTFSIDDATRLSAAASAMGGPLAGMGQSAGAGGKSDFAQALDEIRDKGLETYAKEQQAKKIEEMRKKILESMGLTEDSLAAQPPDQRAAVEKMIDQEVAKRLAAKSIVDNDGTDNPTTLGAATPNGLGASLAMIQAMEAMQKDPRTEASFA
jgi:hypothetical protein